MYFNMAILAMFSATIYIASDWEFGARLVPMVVGWGGVIFTGCAVISGLFLAPRPEPETISNEKSGEAKSVTEDITLKPSQLDNNVHFDIQADYGDLTVRTIFVRATTYFAWLAGFYGVAFLIGLLPAMFMYVVGYMRFEGRERWRTVLIIALPLWLGSYFLFHKILLITWPQSVIGNLFPVLRTIETLNIF